MYVVHWFMWRPNDNVDICTAGFNFRSENQRVVISLWGKSYPNKGVINIRVLLIYACQIKYDQTFFIYIKTAWDYNNRKYYRVGNRGITLLKA